MALVSYSSSLSYLRSEDYTMQINISKYIFQYLKINGAIFLKGIGKIELVRKSAIINDSGIEVKPPHSYFEFSKDSETDLTFISWLSIRTSLSENVCQHSIQNYIDRIQLVLGKGNSFHIPLVGIISTHNGVIDFQSDSWSPYYKYPAIRLSQLAVPEALSKEHKPLRKRLWLIPLFVLILAVSFIGWKSYKSYQSGLTLSEKIHDPEKQGRINQAPVFDSMLTKDSIIESQPESNNKQKTEELLTLVDSLESTSVEKNKENILNTESDITTSIDQSSREINPGIIPDDCIVIVGAFRQSYNVDKMMKRLADDGLTPWKSNHNGLVRVGAKTTCNPEDLNTLLNSCKSKYDAGSWVLE